MKNSYRGYWFSCETIFNPNTQTLLEPRKWILLLENKSNNKIHSIGLNNQMTMGEVLKLAYEEIEKLVDMEAKK
jgi:hypothetical protein|tara:strand:- start:127 stop:348 length:222 start_codon:yes stop_codon:yes gene_type:complete